METTKNEFSLNHSDAVNACSSIYKALCFLNSKRPCDEIDDMLEQLGYLMIDLRVQEEVLLRRF